MCAEEKYLLSFVRESFVNIYSACNYTEITLLYWCFSSFLNGTNGTKLRKASHFIKKFLLLAKFHQKTYFMYKSIQVRPFCKQAPIDFYGLLR